MFTQCFSNTQNLSFVPQAPWMSRLHQILQTSHTWASCTQKIFRFFYFFTVVHQREHPSSGAKTPRSALPLLFFLWIWDQLSTFELLKIERVLLSIKMFAANMCFTKWATLVIFVFLLGVLRALPCSPFNSWRSDHPYNLPRIIRWRVMLQRTPANAIYLHWKKRSMNEVVLSSIMRSSVHIQQAYITLIAQINWTRT